jgi:hypothetical protein
MNRSSWSPVAERWFSLTAEDQRDALEVAAATTGLPAYLLEKDIWVVWALEALGSDQHLLETLTFKGGTSLSKAYGLIDRFSEDIDLTLDIRQLLPDVGMPPAPSNNQAKQRKEDVNSRLPQWVTDKPLPLLQKAAADAGLDIRIIGNPYKMTVLELHYKPILQAPTVGDRYVSPKVVLEFGAHSTGEPHGSVEITCEAAKALTDIAFPNARPLVMDPRRTFWEKATAMHVFCCRGQWGKGDGARYARHWFDVDRMATAGVAKKAMEDRSLARQVADHKKDFWRSKNSANQPIDYIAAINGSLQLVPAGEALEALEADYAAMLESGMLRDNPPQFDELLKRITLLQEQCNSLARNNA